MTDSEKFAIVAVNRPVKQAFHYEIPVELIGQLQIGHLVDVEFGVARTSGIILAFDAESPVAQTKFIQKLYDPLPVVTQHQLNLAYWLAATTLAPIGYCVWLMLPPGITSESAFLYTLVNHQVQGNTPIQKRVLSLLKRRGALTHHQIKRALPRTNWSSAVRQLRDDGALTQELLLKPPKVKPKTIRSVHLAIPPKTISKVAQHLGRESGRANVLEVLEVAPERQLPQNEVMELAACSANALNTLAKSGDIALADGFVQLKCPSEEISRRIIELRGNHIYLKILEMLSDAGGTLDVKTLYDQTGATHKHLERLVDDGYIIWGEMEVWRDPLEHLSVLSDTPPPLTAEQQTVWEVIQTHIKSVKGGTASPPPDTPSVFLIHGVTGSGKTEIYLRAVSEVVEQGRQAIVLVPEIALTAQLVRRFMARFPKRVAIVHSGLSMGERYDTWRRARNGDYDVVVGARSALYTYLSDPALVILDEEHDDSYKQSPPILPPYYHAREVAIEMMRQNDGTVILGSATPDLATMYHAQQGDYVYLELPNRVLAHREKIRRQIEYLHLPAARYIPTDTEDAVSIDLPPVSLVDMRQELRAGNRSIFSRILQEQLLQTLAAKEQTILFLNRRGTATFVMCRDCGYIALCPRCDTPLTYHSPQDALICHYCGKRQPNPSVCPQCQSSRIKHFGSGTEQIHKMLHEMFPQARVLRWDQDTAKERGAHDHILQQFLDRDADILVGTQMIAKGLDIPMVTLVGIISADTSLGLPDYRTGERTFQLLTQVAGRAGRGILGGRVILQTYQPDHYAIQAAVRHDYHAFYQQELRYRRELRYPPFTRLARLLFQNHNQIEAKSQADSLAAKLRIWVEEGNFSATEIVGPTPCFFMRLNNVFRWQILVRSPNPIALFKDIELGPDVTLDIDPVELL